MDRQLKKGEQNIEEEEKKEYSDTERELTSFSIMERKYNPETDTKENYQTIENQYGYYTNKRFDSFQLDFVNLSSELDMPWFESLFDRSDDHRFESLYIYRATVLNKVGKDVTDEHFKKFLDKIIKSRAVEKTVG